MTNRPRAEVRDDDQKIWKETAVRIRLTAALLSSYGDPIEGSPLASDDAAVTDIRVSDAVRSYLTAALDNLSLWANVVMPLVFVADVPVENPPRPYFTLARAGLESAAQAAWILEVDDPVERNARW